MPETTPLDRAEAVMVEAYDGPYHDDREIARAVFASIDRDELAAVLMNKDAGNDVELGWNGTAWDDFDHEREYRRDWFRAQADAVIAWLTGGADHA